MPTDPDYGRQPACAIAANAEQRRRRHAADAALHQIEALLRNCDADPVTTLSKVHAIATEYFCKDYAP